METLMTPREVAQLLGVTPETLGQWRRDGSPDLKYVKLGSRSIRYKRSDVNAFIAGNTKEVK